MNWTPYLQEGVSQAAAQGDKAARKHIRSGLRNSRSDALSCLAALCAYKAADDRAAFCTCVPSPLTFVLNKIMVNISCMASQEGKPACTQPGRGVSTACAAVPDHRAEHTPEPGAAAGCTSSHCMHAARRCHFAPRSSLRLARPCISFEEFEECCTAEKGMLTALYPGSGGKAGPHSRACRKRSGRGPAEETAGRAVQECNAGTGGIPAPTVGVACGGARICSLHPDSAHRQTALHAGCSPHLPWD